MSRTGLTLGFVLGLALVASPAQAQLGTDFLNNDPFNLYYGFYLPRQAALSVQPRPEATINAYAAAHSTPP